MAETQTTDTSTQNQPGQVTYSEFAAKIRAKYPQSQLYKTKPDKELVDTWIQAKPERAIYVKKIKGYDPLNEKPGSVPSQLPVSRAGIAGGAKVGMEDVSKIKSRSAALDQVGAGLPAAGGVAGGIIGGTPGAALGGAIGAGAQDIFKRIVMGDNTGTEKQAALHMLGEGIKQGALEKGGQKLGEGFFYLLNKIPHAVIKNGIKFLPSELNGGKVSKYVEDLLTNLVPSSKHMAEDAAKRNANVIGAVDKLTKGFSRFNGTTEEMGLLLQDTYRSFEKQAKLDLVKQAKGLAKPQDIYKTAEYAAYEKLFKNELAKKIATTNKPELIGGFLRSASSLEETRTMMSMLAERAPKVASATKRRLMGDMVQEVLTGTKDPILKQLQKQDTKFVGGKFKDVIDKMGEEKLKAIYGEESSKAIQEFAKLVEHVGAGGGNGTGKFLNLIFLLGPLRTGLTFVAGKKLATEGFVFSRAAKIVTSTEGVRLYENYIRASGIGAVKAVSAARDQLQAFNARTDAEYIDEQKSIEDEYYKQHPDELKYKSKEETK